jgi:FtsZ-interacting cell division protein ZipA
MALSELQIALIGIGVAVVAAVWIYNVWQERRYRRSAEELFKGTQGDALLGDKYQQTGGDSGDSPTSASSPAAYERTEPVLRAPDDNDDLEPLDAAPAASGASDAGPVEAHEEEAPIDPLVECVVRFALGEGVTFAGMRDASRAWAEPLSKPLRWLACTTDGEWREAGRDEGGRHSRWIAALQLVDRRGAVSAAEVEAFVGGMATLVEELQGDVVPPEVADVLGQAEALDAFCASVDIQFGINVVETRGGTFPATKLRGFCESSGLLLQGDGRYHSTDPAGEESFWVSDISGAAFDAESLRTSALHGVTFTLDVPRIANGVREFERMLALAQQFARAVDGVLVDAQRQPLAEAMIGMIRAKIVELQQRMQDADIPAGGARARKLFA